MFFNSATAVLVRISATIVGEFVRSVLCDNRAQLTRGHNTVVYSILCLF